MTEEELEELFSDDDIPVKWEGDNALKGLLILAKFSPGDVVCGAAHDVIYSISTDTAIRGGMTKETALELRGLNWGVEDGHFYCFV